MIFPEPLLSEECGYGITALSGGKRMDNEYYYNQARNRYYDACSGINYCENRANELARDKNQAIADLNDLNAQLARHRQASYDLGGVIAQEDDLTESLDTVAGDMDEATENFSGMAESSDTPAVNINEVFSDEMTRTRSVLTTAMSDFRTKKTAVDNRITELEAAVRDAELRIADIEQAMRINEADASSWRSTKYNASMDMEYYRRRMDEED